MKISARNILKGKVKEEKHGMVDSEVDIELPGGAEICSIITKQSAETLKLAKRQRGLRGYQGFQCNDHGRLTRKRQDVILNIGKGTIQIQPPYPVWWLYLITVRPPS